MNKQLRDEWVRALRSGEYKQTRNTLQDGDAYCCLGVLCEVGELIGFAAATRSELRPGKLKGHYLTVRPVGNQLPAGFEEDLARMNDVENKTFPEIADWIEANVPVTE